MNLPSPKRSFGQNYLVNPSAIEQIVQEALQSSAPEILEIGPGRGALTQALLQDGRSVHAIEMDPEHRQYLETTFQSVKHFKVHQGDALSLPIPSRGPFTVVGNLPYNAATAILTRFLLEDIPWDRLVFMFQKKWAINSWVKPVRNPTDPYRFSCNYVLMRTSYFSSKLDPFGPFLK